MRKVFTVSVVMAVASLFMPGHAFTKRASSHNGARGQTKTESRLAPSRIDELRRTPESVGFHIPLFNSKASAICEGKISPSAQNTTDNPATMFGYLVYDSKGEYYNGIVKISADGQLSQYFRYSPTSGGIYSPTIMYVRNGKLICIGQEVGSSAFVDPMIKLTITLSTSQFSIKKLSVFETYFNYSAYASDEDMIYGYYLNADDGEVYFGKAPESDVTKIEKIAAVERCPLVAMTYNAQSGKLIGITDENNGGTIVEISKYTGEIKEIDVLAHPSSYVTGLGYSPIENNYYYPYCTSDSSGLDILNGYNASQIASHPFDGLIEFFGLVSPDDIPISDSAPTAATFVESDFQNGSSDGTVTFRMASNTFGGTPILGNIDWCLEIDGEEYKVGSAAAGSNAVIQVSGLTPGIHVFTLRSSLGGNQGRTCRTSLYIGKDTPLAPEKVEMNLTKISWTPVTEGIHGGYVNPSEVRYNVYINGTQAYKELSATECASQFGDPEILDVYVAEVEAVYDGKTSARTSSNDVPYGEAYRVPFRQIPAPEQSRVYTIIDGNDDGYGITYTNTEVLSNGDTAEAFYYEYSDDDDADDWLFLPPINFTDGNSCYNFSFNVFRDWEYDESYEVALCRKADPSTIVKKFIDETYVENLMDDEFYKLYADATFSIPEAGTYYIGIHVTSPAGQFRLWMRDFSVEKTPGITLDSPASVSDLTATADDKGQLKATVSFRLPSTTMSGTAIPNTTTLTAEISCNSNTVTVSGKPGEAVSKEITTAQGDNNILVRVLDGDKFGMYSNIEVHTGVDIPGKVTEWKAVVDDDNLGLMMSWKAPSTTGVNDGYVIPEDVEYVVMKYDKRYGFWEDVQNLGKNVFSHHIRIPEGSPQDLYGYGIMAVNAAGDDDFCDVMCVLGTPLLTPFGNNYTAGENINPLVCYTSGVTLRLDDPTKQFPNFSTTDNAKALYTYATKAIKDGKISLPKFSTEGLQHGAIELNLYGGSCANVSVYAAASDIQEEKIASYDADYFTEKGPAKVRVELPAKFQDRGWVEIYLHFTTSSKAESMIIYSFRYLDNLASDFGIIDLSGTTNAKIGEEATFYASVQNFGYESHPFPGAQWKLVDKDGNLIASATVEASTEACVSDQVIENRLSFTPNAGNIGNLYLTYSLNPLDPKPSNDSKTIEVSVNKGLQPVVTDLSVSDVGYDHVTLQWSPLLSMDKKVQDFENETPLVFDDESGMIAEFKRFDKDGYDVYTPNFSNPLPTAYKPQSFVVWSTSAMEKHIGSNPVYTGHSGDKFIIAFCPALQDNGTTPAADDWLVSPEIESGTDVSFWIKPITYNYGAETIQIMYSSTTDDPGEFKLLKEIKVSGNENTTPTWQEYTELLPNDAKYFALHYVSKDIFGILIDDIAYTPKGSSLSLTGYNVYRDGAMIAANDACSDATFTDNTVREDSDYSYLIVPVLNDNSTGLNSNVVKVHTTGIGNLATDRRSIYSTDGKIIVKGYAGYAVTVYAIDGTKVSHVNLAGDTECFDVANGVYIISASSDNVKIIVK